MTKEMVRKLAVDKFTGNATEMMKFMERWALVTESVRKNAKKKGIDLAEIKVGVKR